MQTTPETSLERVLELLSSVRMEIADLRTEFAKRDGDMVEKFSGLYTEVAKRNEQMTEKLSANAEEIANLRIEIAKQHTDATKESKNNLIATVVVVALATAVTNLLINFTGMNLPT